MRLWHKDLIHILPDAQLKGQWRESHALIGDIKKRGAIKKNGLVDYINNHDLSVFGDYMELVHRELVNRGVRVDMRHYEEQLKAIGLRRNDSIIIRGLIYPKEMDTVQFFTEIANMSEKWTRGILKNPCDALLKYIKAYKDHARAAKINEMEIM